MNKIKVKNIPSMLKKVSMLLAITASFAAHAGSSDYTGALGGDIDTIYADQSGTSINLWITINTAPNTWVQMRESNVGRGAAGVYASALTVAHALNFPVQVRTVTNSLYPGTLEMHDSYIINIQGLGTLGHIASLVKPHPDEPLIANMVTASGVKPVKIHNANQAAIAATAVAKNLPVTYQENCVLAICNGLSWIQIGNAN